MLYNETGTLGIVLGYVTNEVTGSLFMTMVVILMFLMALTILFRIPMEYSAVAILPLLLVLMAYTSEFLVFGSLLLLYLAVVMAKMWILR